MSTLDPSSVTSGFPLSNQRSAASTRKLATMVTIGFALRAGFIIVAHTYRFSTHDANFSFGYEMGRIAASLAEGHGFSSPFDQATGPTAWQPPLYPLMIAAAFKIAGIYSAASAIILLLINSLLNASTAIPVFFLASRSFGARVATWSAWVWTLSPWSAYWAVKWVWETSLSAFVLVVLLLLAWRIADAGRQRDWIVFGGLWGLAALLNTTLLDVLPILALWLFEHGRFSVRKILGGAMTALVCFVAVLAPWVVRNQLTFHQPVLIRSNFGVELRIGNGPGATGLAMDYLHPTHNAFEMAKYRSMGEVAYARARRQEAVAWIVRSPLSFFEVTIARIVYYWTSLPWSGKMMPAKNAFFLASSVCAFWGLWLMHKQRRQGWGLYAIALLVFPLVYYLVFPHPRYRGPIEPEITILVVYLISQTSTVTRRGELPNNS
jgi:4-amino-4-deoxy-L-arabinose transferase-like glycosyltransferase